VRLVFAGTAEFAVPALRASAARHDVAAVVTQPEKPGNRRAPAPRPVRDEAMRLGIPVMQPARIRDPHAVAAILDTNPDALVVAAYGQIIPVSLLKGPRYGGINVHASLLPRWRGAAPVARAILAGDKETGVSIMQMDEGLDTGHVYAQRTLAIAADATTPELTAALAGLGSTLLVDVLDTVSRDAAVATPQDERAATSAPRLTRADGELRWDDVSAVDVDRRVRALLPWPGVMAELGGIPVRLLAGGPADATGGRPGTVLGAPGQSVLVSTKDGAYRIDRLQPPGSRPMTAAAFLRGRRTHRAEQPEPA
jgi:methionyl-tRNA formyltransferase